MSTYRENYTPPAVPRARRSNRLVLIAALIAAVVGLWAFVQLQVRQPAAAAVLTQPGATESQSLADVRVEAFRAGYKAAVQAGCRSASLSMPIIGATDL